MKLKPQKDRQFLILEYDDVTQPFHLKHRQPKLEQQRDCKTKQNKGQQEKSTVQRFCNKYVTQSKIILAVVTLSCSAKGVPTPSISWTKVSDNCPVSFPLTITGKQDEGGYRCTADNSIGNPASQVVYVIVESELKCYIFHIIQYNCAFRPGKIQIECIIVTKEI